MPKFQKVKATKTHTRVVTKGISQGRLTAAQVGDVNARVQHALQAAMRGVAEEWSKPLGEFYIRAFLEGVAYSEWRMP